MKILLYILTPIGAFIINLILGILTPLATLPLMWILSKIKKNLTIYKFRMDMVIQGLIRGFLVVFITNHILSQFDSDVSFWWIVATMVVLSYLSISAWDNKKSDAYESSLNVPPVLGFLVGLIYI
jgi:hypothetical protein